MRVSFLRVLLLTLADLAIFPFCASAQEQPPSITQIYQRLSKVEVKTTNIRNNLYTLTGEEDGGTVGVFSGPDGIVIVDAQYAPLGPKIVAAIQHISNSPIRFLINTHVHLDHTGGNENFGKMGAVIIGREQLRYRLAHGSTRTNGTPIPPAPAAALPTLTYEGRATLYLNGGMVELIAIPRAHTDTDTVVYFHSADAIMCGDIYGAHIPNIDRGNGGSLQGMLDGLGLLIGMAGPETKIIPGHGPVVGRNALIARRDMILEVRDRVAKLIEQGKTPQEVVAAKPAADYEAKFPKRGNDADRFVGQVYAELKTTE